MPDFTPLSGAGLHGTFHRCWAMLARAYPSGSGPVFANALAAHRTAADTLMPEGNGCVG
jgi:hypothetical protein